MMFPNRRHFIPLTIIALLWSGSACVSTGKYEELQKQNTDLQTQVQERDTELANIIKERSSLKASVDEMTAALEDMRKRNAEADRRIQEYKDLLARFKSLIDAGKLSIKIVDGRMVVVLPSDVIFASGSADLSAEGKKAVAEITAVLVEVRDRKYQIEGHTDDVPIRTARFPSNWELAAARAITVVNTMVRAGMPPARVSGASYGDTRPVAENKSEEGRAKNRRIEIVIVPDLSSLPGFEELQELQKEADKQAARAPAEN